MAAAPAPAPVRKARKPATVTAKLATARATSGKVFKRAWQTAKAAGRKRPDASDISAARVAEGLPAAGTPH